MPSELDRSSVIQSITNGIGAEFGRRARRSFHAQMERLLVNPLFRDSKHAEQQALVDVLALAAFYQTVIVPIESCTSFISVVEQAGATHLRVGRDQLDRSYANEAQRIAHGFTVLLERTGVPQYLLIYPSLQRFVERTRAFYESSSDEALD